MRSGISSPEFSMEETAMITNSQAAPALQAALSTGGDFAEIFCQDKTSQTISLQDGRVEDVLTRRIHGAGMRVFRGLSCVYVHSSDTSPTGLMALARRAADAIGGIAREKEVFLVGRRFKNVHPVQQLPLDIPGHQKAALLKEAALAARDFSPEIAHVRASLLCSQEEIQIFNSEGLSTGDSRVRTRMALTAIASDGSVNQTGNASPGALMGYELFSTRVDPVQTATDAARTAVTMLHADNCPAGRMPVVMDGGFGGVIFHEACGHSLEATSVAFGNSEFCGKLGTQIAAPIVTAIDDGTLENEWGSTNIDDEGLPTTALTLIENGILKSYMVDRLNARRMNCDPTGSGRRQDYTFAPTSRMRNTFIAPGRDDENEMIASVPLGLYARKMGGGSVNPATGEFNFSVAEGYMIRGGEIAEPVRGATLIGRGAEILHRIDRVGPRMWMAQGMCGSQSGSVPTNVGQPRIRISEITVGGR